MKRSDLIRAGLFTAAGVVMMKHPTARHRGGIEERLVDATAM